jgi:hypothetical protein
VPDAPELHGEDGSEGDSEGAVADEEEGARRVTSPEAHDAGGERPGRQGKERPVDDPRRWREGGTETVERRHGQVTVG